MEHSVISEETVEGKILNPDEVSNIKLDFAVAKKAAGVLRAVNHKLRQQMLRLMDEKGRVTVTELFTHLALEQSVASQHLAILRQANLVQTQRDGKFIYYAVNYDRLNQLQRLALEIIS